MSTLKGVELYEDDDDGGDSKVRVRLDFGTTPEL